MHDQPLVPDLRAAPPHRAPVMPGPAATTATGEFRGPNSGDDDPAARRLPAAVLEQVCAAHRRDRLTRVLVGELNDVSVGDLAIAVEVDTPLAQSDHTRLLRAASLAIQYYRTEGGGRSKREFLKRFAAALRVDARDLEAYVLVLGREIRHREKTGCSPLNDLPRLTDAEELAGELAAIAHDEHLALPPAARSKHDPTEYVALAEQGLNNTEIARALGDVSEASVRRGLASAGYRRSA